MIASRWACRATGSFFHRDETPSTDGVTAALYAAGRFLDRNYLLVYAAVAMLVTWLNWYALC